MEEPIEEEGSAIFLLAAGVRCEDRHGTKPKVRCLKPPRRRRRGRLADRRRRLWRRRMTTPTGMDPTLPALTPPVATLPDEAAPLVGTVIGGRYELTDLVGRGGMGTVYRAVDRELDEIVALKLLRPEI